MSFDEMAIFHAPIQHPLKVWRLQLDFRPRIMSSDLAPALGHNEVEQETKQ